MWTTSGDWLKWGEHDMGAVETDPDGGYIAYLVSLADWPFESGPRYDTRDAAMDAIKLAWQFLWTMCAECGRTFEDRSEARHDPEEPRQLICAAHLDARAGQATP